MGGRHMALRWREGLWSLALGLLLAVCFTTRLVPEPLSDRSIYQSVGERLLAGDRLYVDVIDNKDPLFYYAVACQRWLGPVAEYAFELACVLGAALIAAGFARRYGPAGQAGPRLVLVGTALMLTGRHYDLGGSIPPGLFLTLLTIRLSDARRPVAGGLAFVLLLFTKLIYAPLPLAFAAGQALATRERDRRMIAPALLAALAGIGAILAVLAARGELAGYAAVQAENLLYSSNNVVAASGPGANLVNHAKTALYFGTPILIVSLVAATVLAGAWWRSPPGTPRRAWLAGCLALYPVSLAIIGLTAIWSAHLAVLHVFLALAAAAVGPGLASGWRGWIGSAAFCGLAAVLAMPEPERSLIASPLDLPERLQALSAPSPEATALRRVAGPAPVRYARLGTDTDFHHAAQTRGDRLACPRFFQYRFTNPAILAGVLRCAATAEVLIVDFPDEAPLGPETPWVTPVADFAGLNRRWDRFVAASEAMLRERFRCVAAGDTLRICRRASRRP